MKKSAINTIKKHSLTCMILSILSLVLLLALLIFVFATIPYNDLIFDSHDHDISINQNKLNQQSKVLLIGTLVFALIEVVLILIVFILTIIAIIEWFSSKESKNNENMLISILLIVALFIPLVWIGLYATTKNYQDIKTASNTEQNSFNSDDKINFENVEEINDIEIEK